MTFTSETAKIALNCSFRLFMHDDVSLVFEDVHATFDPAWVPWRFYRWSFPPAQA